MVTAGGRKLYNVLYQSFLGWCNHDCWNEWVCVVVENIVIEKPEMKRILAEHGFRGRIVWGSLQKWWELFLGQKCSNVGNGVIAFESLGACTVSVASCWGMCTQEPLVRGKRTIQFLYHSFLVLLWCPKWVKDEQCITDCLYTLKDRVIPEVVVHYQWWGIW